MRLEGRAEKVSDALSDAYFDSRPLGSRVSAIVSQQSRELPDRAEFAARLAELMQQVRDYALSVLLAASFHACEFCAVAL